MSGHLRTVPPLAAAAFLAIAALALPVAAQRRATGCAAGEGYEACLQRALLASSWALREARGGGARPALPVELLDDVCAHGVGDGCYFAGRLRLTAIDPAADSAQLAAAQRAAAALFVRGCDPLPGGRPSAAACASAGDAFAFSLGVRADADSAFAYYRRGCALESATACAREAAHLAGRTEEGAGRVLAAEERSVAACRRDSPSGCVEAAAFRLQRLRGVPAGARTAAYPREVGAALGELRGYCGRGLLRACTTLGAAFTDPALGVEVNADSARRYYRAGCQGRGSGLGTGHGAWLGDGAACRGVAELALAGTPPDPAQALQFYQLGCMLFDTAACVEQGRLLPAAGAAADDAYRRITLFAGACAAARPSGAGCRHAAEWFRGPLADTAGAVDFFGRACRLADAGGCLALGVLEDSLRRDPGSAVKHYRQACELGHGGGCARLSRLLRAAWRDAARADLLLERGCGLGDAPSCWERALRLDPLAHEEAVARHRAAACRFDRGYCKTKPPR